MYVLPHPASYFVWDGCFLYIKTFPDHLPGVKLVTEVFYLLVSHAGAFKWGYHYKHWRANEHHIIHILHWIITLFKKNTLDRWVVHNHSRISVRNMTGDSRVRVDI
ncbi:hypothetical protein BJ165DRAFT_236950 [Panaeolus papilionaceus]|nr:hypothetical protein BJ165DRAFT_236950 [Panaeolus papilionaceus]